MPVTRARIQRFVETVRFYTFLRVEGPGEVGHNPVAGVAYLAVYGLCLVEIATGLALWEWLPREDRLHFPGDSWRRLSGYPPDRITSMEAMIRLQHPEDRARAARHLGAMLAGEIEHVELMLRVAHAEEDGAPPARGEAVTLAWEAADLVPLAS